MSKARVEKEHEQGHDAFASGLDETACPFAQGTRSYYRWMRGYHEAKHTARIAEAEGTLPPVADAPHRGGPR